MDGLLRAIRSRARRPWVLGFTGAAVLVIAFFVFSARGGPATLELVTLDDDGRARDNVAVTTDLARAAVSPDRGPISRVPLVLAVRNTGGEPARPDRIEISLPKHLRVSTGDGRPLRGAQSVDNPLVRYRLPGPFPTVEPSSTPTIITDGDTLWLELLTPSVYCVVLADSVPEFLPAPEPTSALSRVQIFYSFEGGDLKRRQTGLLPLNIDPELLQRETPETPPTFPTEVRWPAEPLPPMTALRYVGSTSTDCGAPEEPVEIFATLWETAGGGRFFVIDHGGVARKYMFDLNGDGFIELEVWDNEGTGNFAARRRAHFPIPPFLFPAEHVAEPYDPRLFANVPDDSLGNYDRFRQTLAGGSPAIQPADTASTQRHRPLAIFRDRTATRGRTPAPPRPLFARPRGAPGPPPDPTQPAQRTPPAPRGPALLGEPVESPRRAEPPAAAEPTTPRRQPATPPTGTERPATPPTGAERPATPQQDRPPATEREPEPQPRREPRLLGRPVDSDPAPPNPPRPEGRRPPP